MRRYAPKKAGDGTNPSCRAVSADAASEHPRNFATVSDPADGFRPDCDAIANSHALAARLAVWHAPTWKPMRWPHGRQRRSRRPSVHDRLVQLERLVMSHMGPTRKPDAGHTSDSSLGDRTNPSVNTVDVPSECGSMRVSDSELRYVGGDHWPAILDSFTDLKDQLDREEQFRLAGTFDQTENDNDDGDGDGDGIHPLGRTHSPHALLLYGCRRPSSRTEILSALPPRLAVDRYISRYFNSLELTSCWYTSH